MHISLRRLGYYMQITNLLSGPVASCRAELEDSAIASADVNDPSTENNMVRRKMMALVVFMFVAGAPPAFAQHAGHGAAGGGHQMMESMSQGMEKMKSMPMSGNTDKDFATMMRMHHENGIRMAEVEVKNGKDAKMKQMAQKIIESQRKEIKEFDDWLAKNK